MQINFKLTLIFLIMNLDANIKAYNVWQCKRNNHTQACNKFNRISLIKQCTNKIIYFLHYCTIKYYNIL